MPTTNPAEGERNAIRGLVRQYKDVAAALIYERLLRSDSGALEAVDLVDPRAAKLDDVQITSRDRHDAYQVKWTTSPGGVTLRSLTTADDDDPSPLRQLYDGWQTLREVHTDRPVHVHWVTNAPASTASEWGATVGEGEDRPETPTMAAFLTQVHRPFADHAVAIPDRWQTAWVFLRTSLNNVDEGTFADFMRSVHIDLGYSAPDLLSALPDERQRARHVRSIWSALLDHVADSEAGQRLSLLRDTLLQITGLDVLLAPVSVHDFPLPDLPLASVDPTIDALDDALEHVTRGYVGVVGSPGSGKSTLLSAYARRRERAGDLVVPYYAYTSDGDPDGSRRVESRAFLQDLVLALHARGIGNLQTIPGPDRLSLLSALHRQLADLGGRHAADGTRSILLVDGLDHVNREGPAQGFLADLPTPDQIPQGVVVLVGTQTEQLDHLPPAVREALAPGAPGRVEIAPLSDDAVAGVLREAERLPDLSVADVEGAVANVQGHPLALALLVHRLRDTDREGVSEAVAQAAQPLDLYARLWRDVEDDHGVCHLLGLIARTPGPADLVWLGSWFEPQAAISTVFRRFRHMFRREGDDRWHVFHDSFRVFLVERTRRYMPGGWGRQLHLELAERAGVATAPHAWAELYHRDRAGDRAGVMRLAQPHVARGQFADFRPPSSIVADLAAASAHAATDADTPLLVALATASIEIMQREATLDRYSGEILVFGLARYGRFRDAARLARTGRSLHVSRAAALYLAALLEREGLAYDARELYDLARPRDLLGLDEPIGRDYDSRKQYRLRAWAHAAPLFDDLADIASDIGDIALRANDLHSQDRVYDENDQEASSRFRRSLFVEVTEALVEDQRWDEVIDWIEHHVGTAIPLESDDHDGDWAVDQWALAHVEARIYASASVLEAGLVDPADRLLDRLRGADAEAITWAADELGLNLAVQAAESLHATSTESPLVMQWLPDLTAEPAHRGAWLRRDREAWFRAARLRLLLGESPLALPEPEPGSRDEGFLRFRQTVALLAEWSAAARSGNRRSAAEALAVLGPVFTSFPNASLSRDPEHPDWTDHGDLVPARAWLYATALTVAAEHGRDARDALLGLLDEHAPSPTPLYNNQWPYTLEFWTVDDIRAVAQAAFKAGTPSSWVRDFLTPVEAYAAQRDDVDSRVEHLIDLGRTWHEVGDSDQALRLLQRALRLSLGVGYRKDYQLANLLSLFGWLLDAGRDSLDDGDAARWVAQLARVIELSVLGTESRQADIAAQSLIGHAFSWRPRAGAALARRFDHARIGWEPLVTLEVLRAAVADDVDAIPLAIEVLVHQILPERPQNRGLSDAYPDLAQFLVSRAADSPQENPEEVARALCAHLDRLSADSRLASNADSWKEGVGIALRELDLHEVAEDLDIPVPEAPATTFEPDAAVLFIGDPDRELSWRQLQEHVAEVGFPEALERLYAPEEVSVWGHIIVTFAPRLTAVEARAVTAFVKDHREPWNVDVRLALFDALAGLGLRDLAWELGDQLLEVAQTRQFDTWSTAWGGSLGFKVATVLVKADPDRARTTLLAILAREAAVRPGTIFPWLGGLLPLLVDRPDLAAHWSPVEDYLHALVPNADPSADPVLPDLSDLEPLDGARGLLHYVLALLPDAANARRLAPVVLDELDRRPWRVQRAVEEALSGPDTIRRPLLRILAQEAAENPDRLVLLLDVLKGSVSDLPEDLSPTARHVIETVRPVAEADPLYGLGDLDLSELGILDEDDVPDDA